MFRYKTNISKDELDKHVKPTYIGNNPDCAFNGQTKLFDVYQQSSGEVLSREDARKFSKFIRNTFKTWNLSRKTKYGNINKTKTDTTPEFWKDFENRAKERGVNLLNYIPVMEEFVFYKLGVYGKNAIILGQEMLLEYINTAPSAFASIESMRMQDVLGATTLALTEHLQDQGYLAEAHVPFGGKLLVPPHTEKATLTVTGRSGLPITPEFGTRLRFGMITTDADIPETKKRDLSVLKDFCSKCRLCIDNCLGKAIYEKPIEKRGGMLTRIDDDKCFEALTKMNYCSICLKVCPSGLDPKPKKFQKLLETLSYSIL